jgi:hypothetical protein
MKEFVVGAYVKNKRAFVDVPEGTLGLIVEDYGTGFMVAWDLPNRPIPRYLTASQIGAMFAIDPMCPIRDGFDKKDELGFLELV